MATQSELVKCPFCSSPVRGDRLEKHQRERCPKKTSPSKNITARTITSNTNAPRIFAPTKGVVESVVSPVSQDNSTHYIIDGLDVCFWPSHPSIHPLLILLNEISRKERSFLCVFDNKFKGTLWRFTGEDAFKKIIREVYEPALKEFPQLFVEIEKDSIGYILAESDKRGSPIFSKDKDLATKHQKYIWSNKKNNILSGNVQKNRGITLLNIPALNISARGFAQEPNKLWWSLRERLNPQPKWNEEENSRIPKVPLPLTKINNPEWDESIPMIKVYWEILGAKTTSQLFTEIVKYYERLRGRRRDFIYDINRLDLIGNKAAVV